MTPKDPRFDPIAAYLTEKTGLVFSPEQFADLSRFLDGRLCALHLSAAAEYVSRLDDPVEFRALIDGLTVKETFFYRHEAQFDAFRRELLPVFLSRARAEKRSVRLWSAGCCTGEEPYTLALLAAEAGCLDQVEILATDINESCLEAAMTGAYSGRSVGKVPASVIGKYFEKREDSFLLSESIRRRVAFKRLNLGESCFPSFLNGTAGLDMIFCRNVLIYLDKPKVREIVLRFKDCLREGGVLALGHSEMLSREWPLEVAQFGEAFFYRGRSIGQPPREVPVVPAVRRLPEPPRAVQKPVEEDRETLLLRAEALADAGRSVEAAALCRRILREDSSHVKARYLMGLLELGDPKKASGHFRRTLYLDPGHLPARLHLAQCEERLGRVAEAVREYRNLERLAKARPPEEVLDAKEGITYGMLALMGRRALERHPK